MLTFDEWNETLVKRHTKEVQDKISKARIAVAGLGGLGSNVCVSLAKIGVNYLHIIDFDVVEPSNLNRQAYTMKHLGKLKVDAMKEILLEINPYLKIKTSYATIDNSNFEQVFKDEEIICEAFDNAESKALLVNGILEKYPDKKVVSSSGMGGFLSSNSIKTKRVMRNLYICGDQESGIEEGFSLMAPRVAICANHEANMILRLILGNEEP